MIYCFSFVGLEKYAGMVIWSYDTTEIIRQWQRDNAINLLGLRAFDIKDQKTVIPVIKFAMFCFSETQFNFAPTCW